MFGTPALLGKYQRALGSITSKYANRDFYKGKGGVKGGRITSKGRFVGDPTKRKWIAAPLEWTGFALRPYVSKLTPRVDTKLRIEGSRVPQTHRASSSSSR